MKLPYHIPVPLRSSTSENLFTHIKLASRAQDAPPNNTVFIVVGVLVGVLVLISLIFCYTRYKMKSRLGNVKRGKYHPPSDAESIDTTVPRSRRRRGGPPASNSATEANGNSAVSQVDRNTSIRSIMTLPAYRTKANENEQVIGREGERDGVDVVVEYPTAEELETMRDEEMETLFQIRLARRQQHTEREERRRLVIEARARGDLLALGELAARRRAARETNPVEELRDTYGNIKDRRQRAVSSVSYHDLGVAQLNGTRVRANSHGSEGVGLLSDAASIAQSTRSPSAQSHRRDRSASSVLSLDSDLPSPGLRSGTSTPRPGSNHTRAGSSPEIIGEADLGDSEMPPPDYEDVSLDDVRSGATTPMFNEPPPDYAGPESGQSGDLSATSNSPDEPPSKRSSRGVGGAPQLPSLRIGRLPQIDSRKEVLRRAGTIDRHHEREQPSRSSSIQSSTMAEKEKEFESDLDNQKRADFFEGSTDRTEDDSDFQETPTPAGPPKPAEVPDGGLDAWLQVLGAFTVMLATFGLVNSFGVYQTYYETELLKTSTSSDISWIGSLQGALLMLGGVVSGPLFDAGHFHALTAAGLFLVLFGLFMTSLCASYWQVLLAQGVCVGLGCGFLFLPSAAILSQYFARRRALVLGIQSAGSPIGGIIFPVVFSRLQPEIGFAWATRVIAFILLALAVVPLVFMRPRVPPPRHKRAFFDRDALREPPFLAFAGAGLFAFLGLYVPFFYIQLYSLRRGIAGAGLSAYLVTLLNAGSVLGRILPNFAADYLGSMNMLAGMTLGASVLAFGWFGVGDLAGTVVFALLFGFFNGGVTSLPPSAVVSLTPDLSRLGTRMGMVFSSMGLAVLVGTPIAGAILTDVDDDALWKGLIGFCAATLLLGGAGFALTQALYLRGRRGKEV
ncbi:MFS general substrate transporter [Jackrogersella minutella]|nr:MFS general substrate transporter [Jackrogersella minutella]